MSTLPDDKPAAPPAKPLATRKGVQPGKDNHPGADQPWMRHSRADSARKAAAAAGRKNKPRGPYGA